MPPKTHDLIKLVQSLQLELDSSKMEFLDLVNEFNIEARYPEEKFNFYKKCTKEFTEENIKNIMEFYKWLKSQILF